MPLSLAISPCPNDTFVFHGLLTGAVRAEGLDLAIELHDVQTLNLILRADVRGSIEAILKESETALRPFLTVDGSEVGFDSPAVLATATR